MGHENGKALAQSYCNGRKESEKPCLRTLVEQSGASNQNITADALHLYPAMTEQISEAGGAFLIGLKENQAELLADMKACITHSNPVNKQTTYDKGHGRVETRHYYHYDVSKSFFDERWTLTNFQSLFKVERIRYEITTGKESLETSYYISNMVAKANNQYFNAICGHWSVETNNHIRDVTLREDRLRTKKTDFQNTCHI